MYPLKSPAPVHLSSSPQRHDRSLLNRDPSSKGIYTSNSTSDAIEEEERWVETASIMSDTDPGCIICLEEYVVGDTVGKKAEEEARVAGAIMSRRNSPSNLIS
ncbi:hypothetical protein LPJ66_010206, partial [Kickxella alabastrina]